MKNKLSFNLFVVIAFIVIATTGCQKGDLLSNPNAGSQNSVVPASLLLNHLTYSLATGGGVTDGRAGAVNEMPWNLPATFSQFHISNYQYYRGNNFYSWSNSVTNYDMLKYANLLQVQATKSYGATPNVYSALAKFFKAYCFIWLSQRVGDIPMSQAGDIANLTPAYDNQHDVYKNSLALLDTANTQMVNLGTANANVLVGGDIYGLTNLQWQKVINSYKLRVLMSLSKRSIDNADLMIPAQFATIFNNPAKYPVFTSNGDNVKFTFNAAFNPYPIFPSNQPYNNYSNICKTYLDLTTSTNDPRTFIAATPSLAQLKSCKTIGNFSAYVGADINSDLTTLSAMSGKDSFSFANYSRYYSSIAGANAEPYIVIGFPELCFNIAEAINLGWVTSANSVTWYNKGIGASLAIYGLTQGQKLQIGDVAGTSLGFVTVDIDAFTNNPAVIYHGDDTIGRAQILVQKYIAFFENSGWEAFYNWRRTGVPNFSQGGIGIGTSGNRIPRRWQYPQDEVNYNSDNYLKAITTQFAGKDDLTKDTWLTK